MDVSLQTRIADLFDRASFRTLSELERMKARRLAEGTRHQGDTVREAARIQASVADEALTRAIDTVGKRILQRGKKWDEAIGWIDQELAHHMDRASELLAPVAEWAGSHIDHAAGILAETRWPLEIKLQDFGEGWTASDPEPWPKRHPYWWGVLAAVGGFTLTIAWDLAKALI